MPAPIKVDKGVPIPKVAREAKESKYPFQSMEVGDSFAVSDGSVKISTLTFRVRAAIQNFQKTDSSKRFTVRSIDENTIRVWRTE